MQVLALDLATVTGWAVGPLSTPLTALEIAAGKIPVRPLSGSKRMGEPGCLVGKFLSDAEEWLQGMIERHRPEGIVFEAPIMPQPQIKGGRIVQFTQIATLRKLYGLVGIVEMVCARRGIEWPRESKQATVALHFTGNGTVKGAKERIVAECLRRGWEVKTDDEADAIAIHSYAAALLAKERKARAA